MNDEEERKRSKLKTDQLNSTALGSHTIVSINDAACNQNSNQSININENLLVFHEWCVCSYQLVIIKLTRMYTDICIETFPIASFANIRVVTWRDVHLICSTHIVSGGLSHLVSTWIHFWGVFLVYNSYAFISIYAFWFVCCDYIICNYI